MVKITTKKQFEVLVHQIGANPNIARGVRAFGENKATTEEVWREIAAKLNNFGPPMRTTEEWQRVWIHFKAKLKKKLMQNKAFFEGGAVKKATLTTLEQAAAGLLDMELTISPIVDTFDVTEVIKIEPMLEIEPIVKIEPSSEPELQQEYEQLNVGNVRQTKKRKTRTENRKFSVLQQRTKTQTEMIIMLKKIEKQLNTNNEIMKEMKDLKLKKYEVLNEIKEIKKKKYDALIKSQILDTKIKQQKLAILEKQLEQSST